MAVSRFGKCSVPFCFSELSEVFSAVEPLLELLLLEQIAGAAVRTLVQAQRGSCGGASRCASGCGCEGAMGSNDDWLSLPSGTRVPPSLFGRFLFRFTFRFTTSVCTATRCVIWASLSPGSAK